MRRTSGFKLTAGAKELNRQDILLSCVTFLNIQKKLFGTDKMPKKIVVASGYFDPLHWGHVEYLQQSKEFGDKLIVIVNNDHQAIQKKGFCCMPAAQRVRLIRELECVDTAIESIDDDRTVCKTLAALHPDVFTNGGDQTNQSIPEATVCKELGIQMVDGLGDKIQSSRWLVKQMYQNIKNVKPEYLDPTK